MLCMLFSFVDVPIEKANRKIKKQAPPLWTMPAKLRGCKLNLLYHNFPTIYDIDTRRGILHTATTEIIVNSRCKIFHLSGINQCFFAITRANN